MEGIWNGSNESARHKAFHQSRRTRHALTYMMITDPFTDGKPNSSDFIQFTLLFSDQLDWTLEEIGKVWMRTKREKFDNRDYVWKVLLSECFIKFYMDWFAVSKQDAEKMIKETPLRNEEDDSGGDEFI